jgi:hypothetical protein
MKWLCLLACVGQLALTGCSSFNREWREAGKTPTPTDSIAGRWEGRWLSHTNGHNGALRCIIQPETNGFVRARFRATYLKVARFSYTVPLAVTASNGVWHFRGKEDLGVMAGGVYRYTGTASVTNFAAAYTSKYDGGIFQMQRPE